MFVMLPKQDEGNNYLFHFSNNGEFAEYLSLLQQTVDGVTDTKDKKECAVSIEVLKCNYKKEACESTLNSGCVRTLAECAEKARKVS